MANFVRAMTFHDDGVSIDYASPQDDLRANGLVKNHILFIPTTDEYAELIDGLIDAVHKALSKALTDFDKTPAPDLSDLSQGEDDSPSPWDNPEERDIAPVLP